MAGEIEDINLEILKKAHTTLKKFIESANTEIEKAGVVQAFEFCYELAWKTIKRFLYNEGVAVSSPRESFREAGRNGLNNEFVLKEIIDIVPIFEKELSKLIEKLEKKIGNEK